MGHFLFRFTTVFLKSIVIALNDKIESVRFVPIPITYLSAYAACIVPSIPAIAPSTPACEHVGTFPAGGGALKMHR